MRAVRLHETGGPEVLKVEEVPAPTATDGQVLIDVRAAGVNFADVMQRKGISVHPTVVPMILGLEVAGTVAALGTGVSGLRIGQPVVALAKAGYAERAVAPRHLTIPVPDGIDLIDAAVIPIQGVTAYQILHVSARLAPGETVLVHAAAGGLGSLAIQLAKRHGATVVATASSAEKRAFARSLGADHAIDYQEDDWPAKVLALTSGRGVDVVLEMVGAKMAEQSLACMAPFSGRMVVYGAASGERQHFWGHQLMVKNHTVIGYELLSRFGQGVGTQAAVDAVCGHLMRGEIKLARRGVYRFDQAADAHRALEGRASIGKLVLVP
jgi:NADPH2:quinone reductase